MSRYALKMGPAEPSSASSPCTLRKFSSASAMESTSEPPKGEP
jgi:hypothetical protein